MFSHPHSRPPPPPASLFLESDLRCLESVTAHEDAVNAVAVAADGTVYTGSADSRIRVWAKALGEKKHSLVATLQKHKSAVNALALSDDGSVLYSGSCDRSILVWEKEDSAGHMAVTGALRGHTRAILCLANVGDLLLSGSADQTVRIWRRCESGIRRYACLAVIQGHEKAVKALAAAWEDKGAGEVIAKALQQMNILKVEIINAHASSVQNFHPLPFSSSSALSTFLPKNRSPPLQPHVNAARHHCRMPLQLATASG